MNTKKNKIKDSSYKKKQFIFYFLLLLQFIYRKKKKTTTYYIQIMHCLLSLTFPTSIILFVYSLLLNEENILKKKRSHTHTQIY